MEQGLTRIQVMGIAVLFGAVFVAILSFSLPDDSFASAFLIDRLTRIAPYPFTIQNLMWLLFSAGMGDLYIRYRRASDESRQIRLRLLPEDDATMLRIRDLGAIYRVVRETAEKKGYFLQRLISRSILQFQGSKSVDQANSLLNSGLELFQHQIDLKYNMLRYLVWLIPTLGFVGTVIGIAMALDTAGNVPDISDPSALKPWMHALTSDLGVAFNTTLLALLLSAVLVFLLHFIQEKEEMALNSSGQYCLDNLINRLYEE